MIKQSEEPTKLPHYRIRAFKATDDYEACVKFHEGHTKVLSDYGIENLNTAQPGWITDDCVYVITVEDQEGNHVGGLRVHKYTGPQCEMPLIDALRHIDNRVEGLFLDSLPDGTAEVCGLWNAKEVFGMGFSALLCICSAVVTGSIGLRNLYCFSAPYTEKMIKTNGCINVTTVGNNGKFNYPTEKFVSSILCNPDVFKLEHAEPYKKERILSLMEEPNQDYVEQWPKGKFLVTYEMIKKLDWRKEAGLAGSGENVHA